MREDLEGIFVPKVSGFKKCAQAYHGGTFLKFQLGTGGSRIASSSPAREN
jgi:hypothetical protein